MAHKKPKPNKKGKRMGVLSNKVHQVNCAFVAALAVALVPALGATSFVSSHPDLSILLAAAMPVVSSLTHHYATN